MSAGFTQVLALHGGGSNANIMKYQAGTLSSSNFWVSHVRVSTVMGLTPRWITCDIAFFSMDDGVGVL